MTNAICKKITKLYDAIVAKITLIKARFSKMPFIITLGTTASKNSKYSDKKAKHPATQNYALKTVNIFPIEITER